MKISQIYNLNKSQHELDFVDIYTDRDIPLFLDPSYIDKWTDPFSLRASDLISNFFQTVIGLVQADEIFASRSLFSKLKEPRETYLGLSPTGDGKGVTQTNADEIFDNIIASQAIESGLLEDLADVRIFVDNFDKDRLSDMTTNIIRKQLIEYTIDQCSLHDIPLTENIVSGYYWNLATSDWDQSYEKALITPEEKRILLVPKRIVSFSKRYTSRNFYQHFVLNFFQEEELKNNGFFVKRRKKTKEPYVTKEDVKVYNDGAKLSLITFAKQHPSVFRNFKKTLREEKEDPIINELIDNGEINRNEICDYLIADLKSIPAGNSNATQYHKLATSILSLLLYPNLYAPKIEQEIHSGRKRIDILFQNSATSGVFKELAAHKNTICPYIPAECKNYTKDVSNPELDQLSGRFSNTRGWVGLMVFRSAENLELILDKCKDAYTDGRGLIIPLTDDDLISGLIEYTKLNESAFDQIINKLIYKIQIG